MRRTIYLSFDLSKREERACYKFLVDLDRTKKKMICMLLINTGLVNPKVIINDEELPKLKNGKELYQKRERQPVQDETNDDVIDEPVEKMLHLELDKADAMAFNAITPTFPDGTLMEETEEDNPYLMFTEEQIQNMQEKGIDYERLNRRQLQVLADRLNEGDPYKAALLEAQFTQ